MENADITWTQEEQRNTLAAIGIYKAYLKGDVGALTQQMVRISGEIGVEAVLSGYNNLCSILAKELAKQIAGGDMMVLMQLVEDLAKSIRIVG
ncbi:hypothetical protein KQR54_33540 [Mycobacterium gordonae]|uniref:hypothetical protein n=1 Tax=Mycobacterium gordonae TaxID=1778 RepID=UPI0021087EF5|nr:hypothetical protein [Mycobacterium gordonae]MCQ4365930.1 hypothetical protein [Mycobacterium gordonae]